MTGLPVILCLLLLHELTGNVVELEFLTECARKRAWEPRGCSVTRCVTHWRTRGLPTRENMKKPPQTYITGSSG